MTQNCFDNRMPTYEGNGEIVCPSCGGNNLHHHKLRWYSRPEDSDQVTKVKLTGAKAEIEIEPSITSRNPSGRRDGFTVSFTCETCTARPRLAIYQHKGSTFIEWQDV